MPLSMLSTAIISKLYCTTVMFVVVDSSYSMKEILHLIIVGEIDGGTPQVPPLSLSHSPLCNTGWRGVQASSVKTY